MKRIHRFRFYPFYFCAHKMHSKAFKMVFKYLIVYIYGDADETRSFWQMPVVELTVE